MTNHEQRKAEIRRRVTALEQEVEELKQYIDMLDIGLPDQTLRSKREQLTYLHREHVRLLVELRQLEGAPDVVADERPYPGTYMF